MLLSAVCCSWLTNTYDVYTETTIVDVGSARLAATVLALMMTDAVRRRKQKIKLRMALPVFASLSHSVSLSLSLFINTTRRMDNACWECWKVTFVARTQDHNSETQNRPGPPHSTARARCVRWLAVLEQTRNHAKHTRVVLPMTQRHSDVRASFLMLFHCIMLLLLIVVSFTPIAQSQY